MNNIISPNNIGGVVINKLEYTLDIRIALTFIGNELTILIFLPSKLFAGLVIDVIKPSIVISNNIINDILLSIKSLAILNVFGYIREGIRTLYLIDIPIEAIKNNTNPNPALIINTGILKNIDNSFFN